MVFSKLSKSSMWIITISSKRNLSDKDRDFIAELVSEEARKAIKSYSFILHEIVESRKYCKLFVESTKTALDNLLEIIKDNLPYECIYASYS